MTKYLLVIPMTLAMNISHANQNECAFISNNSEIKLTIRSSNDFLNCFILEDLPTQSEVAFVVSSSTNTKSTLILFERFQNTNASKISSHISDDFGIIATHLDTLNRQIGFRLSPTQNLDTNKNLRIEYNVVDNNAIVLLGLENSGSTSELSPLPE
jgi:hypothetical protein